MSTDFLINILESNSLSNFLLFASLIVTSLVAYFTIKNINNTTSKQIENQNKQNYRPYLHAKIIGISETFISDLETFGLKGNRYFEAQVSKGYLKVNSTCLFLTIELENYGNGLIDQLKLFDYEKGISLFKDDSEYISKLSNDSYLMTIPKDGKIQIQLKFHAAISPQKLYGIFEKRTTDHCTLLFTYKDINGNLYSTKFIIDLYYKEKPLIKYELFGSEERFDFKHDMIDENSELYSFLKRNSKRK